MDVTSLKEHYPRLIEHMRSIGYHEVSIARFNAEIRRIIRYASTPDILSYEDFCDKMYGYGKLGVPKWKTIEKARLIHQIKLFDEKGVFPDNTYHHTMSEKSNYSKLSEESLSVVDYVAGIMRERNLAESTINTSVKRISKMFVDIFNKYKIHHISDITEEMIEDYFIDHGKVKHCTEASCCIRHFLENAKDHSFGKECARIAKYIPHIQRVKRMYLGLSDENKLKVEHYILDESNDLSLRDRAIMLLVYYTGLRSCDIANLKINNIDWKSRQLQIIQKKTGEYLVLPLEGILGNALFDYITKERYQVNIPNIFLASDHHYRAVKPGTIGGICTRTMEKAGINVKECRCGTHVFRHKITTDLIDKGINIPTISAILGHKSPHSINHYTGSSYNLLKDCSLSIADFPIRKEVLA